MQLCSGAVRVHRREGVCLDGESVQSMAVNTSGTILAVVTQLHLHFWSAGPHVVYLTSIPIPGTSLEENPAMLVLWRQRPGSHLAVVTARRVVFFEADINLRPEEFLEVVKRKRYGVYLHHVDSASRVCYSSEFRIETGIVACAAPAGPYAFLVTTTAGVVYVVGWHQQGILHQWTTVGLQTGGHVFQIAVEGEETASAGRTTANDPLARPGDAAALNPNASATTVKQLSGTTAPQPTRVDPLQRRFLQDGQRPSLPPGRAPADALYAASPSSPSCSTGVTGVGPSSGVIRPPGAAVRIVSTPSHSNDRSVADAPHPEEIMPVPSPSDERGNLEERVARQDRSAPVNRTSDAAACTQRPSCISCISSSAVDSTTVSPHRSVGAERLSGIILHASFAARWKVLSLVFSCGSVALCRTSCGTNFTHEKVQLHGSVTPLTSSCMAAINVRHLLLAVCTQAGAISCRRVDATSLTVLPQPLWKGLRGLCDALSSGPSPSAPLSPAQSLGLIAGMEWSPSEELLCVASYKFGMVLVHYSGGVITRHLSGSSSAGLLRQVRWPSSEMKSKRRDCRSDEPQDGHASRWSPEPRKESPLGCSAIAWSPDGTRLWMAAPRHCCFFSVQMSRVLTVDNVGPSDGCHTPLALLADSGLYLCSVSEAGTSQAVLELILIPEEYLREQYPLLYGAVSSDGSWIACAGRCGLVLFNRERCTWRLASKKQEELSFSCIADPVWLRDVAVVVPALRKDSKTFELIVFCTSSVSPSHASARIALDGRPSQLSTVHQDHLGEGYVVVVDCSQIVRVFRYVFTDNVQGLSSGAPCVALTSVQQLALSPDLASPLHVYPVCLRGEEDDREFSQRIQDQVELLLLLHKRSDHSLVLLRGVQKHRGEVSGGASLNAEPEAVAHVHTIAMPFDDTRSSYVFRCWVDRTAPVRGAALLMHEEKQGLVLTQLMQPSRHMGNSAFVATQRMEVAATRDSELLPLCPSPFDGCMICIGTDTSASYPSNLRGNVGGSGASPRPQMALRPVLYAHRILSLLLLAAMPTAPSNAMRFRTAISAARPSDSSNLPDITGEAPVGSTSMKSAWPSSSFSSLEMDGRAAAFLWDRKLFYWLERMRLSGTFTAALDLFLHTALNDTPPASVPGLSQRSAVRATITLLRNYPEYYAIVMGCVRKMDFTRWHLVLDFLGSPTDFFHECMAHHRYTEALHLVRVIMMGNYNPAVALSAERLAQWSNGDSGAPKHLSDGADSLQQANDCAVELFQVFVENGSYAAACDIMRFMALLEEEIAMPIASGIDFGDAANRGTNVRGAGGSSGGFLSRWLRQLTFSGVAYDDYEAVEGYSVGATTAVQTKTTAATSSGAMPLKVQHRVEGFPALLFSTARCIPSHDSSAADEASEEMQRQEAVRHVFQRYPQLPNVVHQEALRLLRTGYVKQLTKLLETFSFSVMHFLHTVKPLLSEMAREDSFGALVNNGGPRNTDGDGRAAVLQDIFDGLHKELGLPRSFFANTGPSASTAWSTWLTEHQIAQVAGLPGVLSGTNPKVWTLAQSTLYATTSMLRTVQSLHQMFSCIFVYDLAFSVLLMCKSNLISLLLSRDAPTSSMEQLSGKSAPRSDVSSSELMAVFADLDALLSVPENAAYKPFLQDVFVSLPPSALCARESTPTAAAATALPTLATDVIEHEVQITLAPE